MKRKHKKHFQRGFSLIELIFSFTIILLSLLSLFPVIIAMKKSTFHAGELIQNRNIAESILNDYKNNRSFEALTAVPKTQLNEFIYNIDQEEIDPTLKRLTIKMAWRKQGQAPGLGANTIQVTTYVLKEK